MFETFDSAVDGQSAGRFALSTTASLALLGLLGLAAVTAATTVQHVIAEKKVDVVFRPPPPPPPPVAKVEPPPPPPPPKPKAAPPKPKVEAAPVVAAPAALVAPKEVPLEKPPEADAANAVAAAPMAVGGIGRPVAGAIVAGPGTGEGTTTLGAPPRAAPINLPENATPPQPLDSNLMPEYPPEARSQGLEGMVILKGVVEVDGRVTGLKVMKGEEPFASAALQAVRTWRFEPALVSGQPTAVYRIFKVPFRLRS
jgi:protein TonB